MAQDFAKKKNAGTKRASTRKNSKQRPGANNPPRGNGLRLYLSGVISGVFICFIGYLALLPDGAPPGQGPDSPTKPEAEIPKPRFEFYTLLPNQTIDIEEEMGEVEPAADISKPPTPTGSAESYVLQAGSFRQMEDAERRRAELLLLGLEPNIEESNGDNGRWFRVYVGPFKSQAGMTKARSLTAGQSIDTLVLKRGSP